MSASRVRTFVEMESHPIPMQHWEMNLNLDPHMHTNMQMQVEAQSHAASTSSSSTTLSRTGKRQRTDAGISNIGVRIQQAMRQAQAMRQTMSMQHTQHRTHTSMNTASASPQAARIQSLAPVPVSPMNTPMNTSHHVQPMSMCVEDMDLQGTSTRTGTTTRTHWVCDSCGSSTMDHSMGCMHEESSLRCVSDD